MSSLRGIALLLAAGACTTTPAVAPSPMIVASYQDAKFEPVSASRPDGAQIAVLSGDPAAGPSSMLMKMPRSTGALHIHTHDYHLVIVEGSMKHWAEGESEAAARTLGPGGYWFQPGGAVHADSCLSDTCVMYIQWSGPRDARLPE